MEWKIDQTPGYVLATLAGPLSLDEILRAYHAAYDAAFNRGSGLILLDCSGLVGELSTLDRYKLGESAVAFWSSKSWQVTPRIAVVGKSPVIDGFGVMVASNRGVNSVAFPEMQPALDWLGVPKASDR